MNIFKKEKDFYRRFKKVKKNAYKLNLYDQGYCGKNLENMMWPNKDNFANFGYSSKQIIKKNKSIGFNPKKKIKKNS